MTHCRDNTAGTQHQCTNRVDEANLEYRELKSTHCSSQVNLYKLLIKYLLLDKQSCTRAPVYEIIRFVLKSAGGFSPGDNTHDHTVVLHVSVAEVYNYRIGQTLFVK